MTYLVGVPLLYAILFGSILGGSSSVVVVSIAHKINVSEKCSTILTLESSITDILCVVVSLAVVGIILTGQIDYSLILQNILGKFLIGAFVGFVLGLLWLILLKRVANLSYSCMLTLSVVLFGYTASEYIGGSGALSSLLFGLVLRNERAISAALKRESLGKVAESDLAVDAGLKRFESEIAFLIRTQDGQTRLKRQINHSAPDSQKFEKKRGALVQKEPVLTSSSFSLPFSSLLKHQPLL